MQPNFNLDSVQYQGRLPKKYSAQNNPFRMLIFVQGYCLPDKKLGYIEVTIDEEKQRVSTEVKIESC